MNLFDKQFQIGSFFLISLYSLSILFLIIFSIYEPEYKYYSLTIVIVGIFGIWKQIKTRFKFK